MKIVLLYLVFNILFWYTYWYKHYIVGQEFLSPSIYKQYKWEVIQQYRFNWVKKNLVNIPLWKQKIYDKHNVYWDDLLLMISINNIECWGNQRWYCKHNNIKWWRVTSTDWWNFQWNNRYNPVKVSFIQSLIKINDYKHQFDLEVVWMKERIQYAQQWRCRNLYWTSFARCFGVAHNGSQAYGNHTVIVYNLYTKRSDFIF